MLTRVCLTLLLIVALPVWSQVDTDVPEEANRTDQTRMLVPPPVNGAAYPAGVGSETQANYLRTGLTFNTAYSDNVFAGASAYQISDTSYSIFPTIEIDKVTARQNLTLNYSPGFTIYQRTSAYDQVDQNVLLNFGFRLSPHVTLSMQDSLLKTSNALNQPEALSAGAISGSAQPPPIAIIAPIADQLSNVANIELTYQFSRDSMIGGAGTFTNLNYPNPAQVPGLYDSSSRGGSVFYSHRLSTRQYAGATYQYSQILAYPVNAQTEVQTHAPMLFYTVYLKPTLSVSLSGGPQHVDVSQASLPAYHSWSPAAMASMGWQGFHTNFAASYLRLITGGGGLVGAFQANNANLSARWQLARTWSTGLAAGYASYKNVTPLYFLSTPGGHSLFGTVSVQHPISQRFRAELGYTRLRQSYSGIPLISNHPNTNREFISITYQLVRPLGR